MRTRPASANPRKRKRRSNSRPHPALAPAMTEREQITRSYDDGAQREYGRLLQSPLQEAEWELTIELIDEYVPEGSSVVDIGAGPGRYSEHLLKRRGCEVGLVDLSESCLALFNSRVGEAHRGRVQFTWKSCATDLSWIAGGAVRRRPDHGAALPPARGRGTPPGDRRSRPRPQARRHRRGLVHQPLSGVRAHPHPRPLPDARRSFSRRPARAGPCPGPKRHHLDDRPLPLLAPGGRGR